MNKVVSRLILVAAFTLFFVAMCSGCAVKGEVRPDALVIASCPELPPVAIVTPADAWRLLVDDAEVYNTCRCAALKDTSEACKLDPK